MTRVIIYTILWIVSAFSFLFRNSDYFLTYGRKSLTLFGKTQHFPDDMCSHLFTTPQSPQLSNLYRIQLYLKEYSGTSF